MTDKDRSDSRRIHIGPAPEPAEDDGKKNVFHLPTEVINTHPEPTRLFERAEIPHHTQSTNTTDRVRAVVGRCRTAISRSSTSVDRDEKVEKNGTKRDVSERHTFAASSLRRREINEKCETIREVTLTALTIAISISIVFFMIWLNFILYSWTH